MRQEFGRRAGVATPLQSSKPPFGMGAIPGAGVHKPGRVKVA